MPGGTTLRIALCNRPPSRETRTLPPLCVDHRLTSIMTAAILIWAFREPGTWGGQDR
jgi:hypothetical protein